MCIKECNVDNVVITVKCPTMFIRINGNPTIHFCTNRVLNSVTAVCWCHCRAHTIHSHTLGTIQEAPLDPNLHVFELLEETRASGQNPPTGKQIKPKMVEAGRKSVVSDDSANLRK